MEVIVEVLLQLPWAVLRYLRKKRGKAKKDQADQDATCPPEDSQFPTDCKSAIAGSNPAGASLRRKAVNQPSPVLLGFFRFLAARILLGTP